MTTSAPGPSERQEPAAQPGEAEQQPPREEGFSVLLTSRELVRRRDEIIARTQAEIDELESRAARG